MIRTTSGRFFLVVTPLPLWLWAALAIVVGLGIWTLVLNPRELDSALGMTLFLQMFAASTGFSAAAARGYFDPLLVSGRSRASIALGHLLASAAPGAVAWVVLSGTALLLGGGGSAGAGASSRHVAFVIVSCVAWGAGLVLPRLAAGALWGTLLLVVAMNRGIAAGVLLTAQSAPSSLRDVLFSAVAFAVCPFLLLGDVPAASDVRVLAVASGAAAAFVGAGVVYVSRHDFSLAEPA